jgi:SAM-dependent methyltransferase
MIESKFYDKGFYKEQEYASYLSGKKIIPLINELFQPESVVDLGCGLGNWLKVWAEDFNIKDYLGVEGPYVNPEMLMVAKDKVIFADLKQKLNLNRRFDIAMSMEVAEHIEPSSADLFIENLTKLSDIIIFSAAIPNQEGTYHINEQNPEYWANKFKKNGYVVVDHFRRRIWNDREINYWYRQNILLFIKEENIYKYPILKESLINTDIDFLLRIHPELLGSKMDRLRKIEPISGYIHWQLYMLKIKFKNAFKMK